MIDFLLGAIAMAAAVAGLVFLRYYGRTRDRFFLYFTASLWLETVGRVLSVSIAGFDDSSNNIFILRFIEYLLILLAILDKNFAQRRDR
ncbi:MAG TPA: DUF5985 family protein [Rudaea sp.]|nr:DUF5985 family protein [Rudaea sp.]